jgi:hypothetical protein
MIDVSRPCERRRRRALKLDDGSLAYMRLGSGARHDHAHRKTPTPAKDFRIETATLPGVRWSASG